MKLNVDYKYYGRRLLAYVIDWYVGGVLIALPITMKAMEIDPLSEIAAHKLNMFSTAEGLSIGAMSIFIGLLFYLFVPALIWDGQTLGKKITKLKIVSKDGSKATYSQLVMRQVVGIILIEGTLYNVSNMIHQFISLLSGYNLVPILGQIAVVFTIVSVFYSFFNPQNQALHDLISKTKVEKIA